MVFRKKEFNQNAATSPRMRTAECSPALTRGVTSPIMNQAREAGGIRLQNKCAARFTGLKFCDCLNPALTREDATIFRLLRRLVVWFPKTNSLLNEKFLSLVLCISLILSLINLSFAQNSKQKSSVEDEWVESTLKKLSLREKIGQMIVVRVSGEFSNFDSERFADVKKHLEQNKVGGVIVARGDVNEIAALTNEMQRISKIPLLIAADYERGLRMQLRSGTPFTTNMGVGASGDTQAAYRQGKIIAEEMRAIGVNWLYAPVADINNNADNPVINVRSFGEDPQRVGEFVSALVKGVSAGGALSTIKHFPGHGDTATDSHIGLSVVPLDRARLDKVELVPFRAAISVGADSVMTAHVAVPKVTGDNTPATLSPKMTNDLLRKELGFNGIITTDAMEMGAIVKNYQSSQSSVMVVKAGADVVLLPLNAEEAINAIEDAVKKNEITEERINESVRRLLHAKYRLGLAQNRFVDLSKVNRVIERPESVKEANATAEKSITLLRNKDNFFPLTAERANKTLFVVIAADDEPEEGRTFIPQAQARTKTRVIRTDPRTTKEEYEAILSSAQGFDSIVLAPFVKRAASKGTVALPEKQTEFVRKVISMNKPVAVIAFGSPYLIRQFPEAQTYVVTYAIEDVAQQAAVKVLFGDAPFAGKLPVSVPNLFEVGAGIMIKNQTGTFGDYPCDKDVELLKNKRGEEIILRGEDLKKRVVDMPAPQNRIAHTKGEITVAFLINEKGNVKCAFITGHPLVKATVAETLTKWKFQPVKSNGKTVSVKAVVTLDWNYGVSEIVFESKKKN